MIITQKQFEPLIETRDRVIDGVNPWYCAREDTTWSLIVKDWEDGGGRMHVQSLCQNFRVVIQAGGHQGMYPRLLSDMFQIVYTFEPNPLNFHCLVNNCQKENIIKIQAALGEKVNWVKNLFPMDNLGMNKVEQGGAVPMLTIDTFTFEQVDLIWLDVESSEFAALKGAKKTIKKWKPVIAIENETPEISAFLEAIHYKVKGAVGLDKFYMYER
jgi:FkbM family methyltransferase